MSQQQFPSQQAILIYNTEGQLVREHYDQELSLAAGSPFFYTEVDAGVDYQYYTVSSISPDVDYPSTAGYIPSAQAYNPVNPFFALPPSPSIPTSDPNHGPTNESSPVSSLSRSTSTSSTASATSNEACRQSRPNFNDETQQWSCGGCSKTFSDKYGTERHIATVGIKVACRYCGSRVSTLPASRRRHLRRESCRKQAIQRGFTTRNEDDAFVEI